MLNIKIMIVIPINVVDAFLSEDGRIAVASLTTFVITSIVFFTFGYLCCHYQQNLTLLLFQQ